MDIDYGRLRSVTAREIISALLTGSITILTDTTFRRKTLRSMINQARWTESDLERLKLIR